MDYQQVSLGAYAGTAIYPGVSYPDHDARVEFQSLSDKRFTVLVNMDSYGLIDPARSYVPTLPRVDDIGPTPKNN